MSTVKVSNIQHASAGSAAITLDANGQATLNGLNFPTEGSLSGRNRIINGDMRIDQRNAGASVTPTADLGYTLDRWQARISASSKFSIQQSQTAPAGFTNSILVTSLAATSPTGSDYYFITQKIEGFNTGDLAWGTSDAKAVTLSFWVRSSLTGTFGGVLQNSASNRSYPFSYAISSADTWEQKTITIAGDTSGTWLTTNGIGIGLRIDLGSGSSLRGTAGSWAASDLVAPTGATSVVGTNGATFYITGVQLEAGSVATPFERRSYGQELALCQRYYYKLTPGAGAYFGNGFAYSATSALVLVPFPVPMRAAVTAMEQSGTASDYRCIVGGNTVTCNSVPTFGGDSSATSQMVGFPFASSTLTTGQANMGRAANATAFLAWSAEL